MKLPTQVGQVVVPPIKCQGIKTKLVPFILSSIRWQGVGRWVEPFLGSGVVAFNVAPREALLSDSNPYVIEFYKAIYDGAITPGMVKRHLEREGRQLLEGNRQGKDSYYYRVRERFNKQGDPLDFLFLSRSCFNGMIRFNRRGQFNVPFCRKPDRFRPAYVTKIVNQVEAIRKVMYGKKWEFRAADWRTTLREVASDDFVYLDPPYIGRHTDYYSRWSDEDAVKLADIAWELPGGFALSMWKENRFRVNHHISSHWSAAELLTEAHYYHVGPTEALRNPVVEALLIKPGFVADQLDSRPRAKNEAEQLVMPFFQPA